MTEITLIRHGQAQTGAQDEASYDKLSDMGHEQAAWLGEHIRQTHGFDRIISGAMNRQIQTAESLGLAGVPHEKDARLNEFDYFGLSHSLHSTKGDPLPTHEDAFIERLPKVLDAWRTGEILEGLESYASFCGRITDALSDASQLGERVLLVTSTGVISTLATIALDLDTHKKSKMFLSVAHTSMHKFALRGGDLHLTQFGATPHLDHHDRIYARTFA